eukprot:10022536-Heterocapsa_arctica.AAC.1
MFNGLPFYRMGPPDNHRKSRGHLQHWRPKSDHSGSSAQKGAGRGGGQREGGGGGSKQEGGKADREGTLGGAQ